VTEAGIADTSVFIARESNRPINLQALPDVLAVSIVTVAELRAGVLAAADLATRDRRLSTLQQALDLDPLPIDDGVAQAWARLRIELRDSGRRMKVNDAWIAATALAQGLPLVSQDSDYEGVPSLEVIRV
jgi:predicted nucleic acid-binding protein